MSGILGKQAGVKIVLLAAALGAAAVLVPSWPRDQRVQVVLGDGAARVEEVRIRYDTDEGSRAGDEPVREADFRYEAGAAPRVVGHVAHVPDGDYVLAVDVSGQGHTVRASRNVKLVGGSTSIDVSQPIQEGL